MKFHPTQLPYTPPERKLRHYSIRNLMRAALKDAGDQTFTQAIRGALPSYNSLKTLEEEDRAAARNASKRARRKRR